MNIPVENILLVIGGAVALVTAVWHAAMGVGRLTVRMEEHESRLDGHDEIIREVKEAKCVYREVIR